MVALRCSHCNTRFSVAYQRDQHERRCTSALQLARVPTSSTSMVSRRAFSFGGHQRHFAPPRGTGSSIGKYRYLYGRYEYFALLMTAAVLQVENATTKDEVMLYTEQAMDSAYDQQPEKVRCARSAAEARTKMHTVAQHFIETRNGFYVGLSRHGWDAVEEIIARGMLPPLSSELCRALTPPLRRVSVASGDIELSHEDDDSNADHLPSDEESNFEETFGQRFRDRVETRSERRSDRDRVETRSERRSDRNSPTLSISEGASFSSASSASSSSTSRRSRNTPSFSDRTAGDRVQTLALDLRIQTRLSEMGFKDELENARAIDDAKRVSEGSFESIVELAASMLVEQG